MITGYEYDEFGNLERSGENGFLNDVTFTGSVSDTSTGLQYMNARYYNPKTGRFLSQDTYSGNPYDPWTQHLYAYCGNNPTSMIDPTGHFYYLGPTQYASDDPAYLTYEPESDEGDNGGYRDPDPEHPITDEARERAKYIYGYLDDLGWDDDAIYAVLGNLFYETQWTLDPKTQSPIDSGYGIAQWTREGYNDKHEPYSLQALKDYLNEKDIALDSLEGQVEYLVYSMQPGKGQWKRPENEDYYNYFLSPEHFASGDLTYLDDPSLFPEDMTPVQKLTQIFFYSYERSGDFFNTDRYWFGEEK